MRRTVDSVARRLRASGLVALSLLLGWIAAVALLTVAVDDRSVRLDALAASPSAVARGRLWPLVTSGLVVQHPVVLSLACAAALAFATLAACGADLLWVSAVAGHVGSTLLAYALFASYRALEPHAFAPLSTRPDYGVSAISAAWLGALACTGWRSRGVGARGRAAVVLACAASGVFAYMLRRSVTILDADHVFAFAIGIAVAAQGRRLLFAEPSAARGAVS